MSLTATATIREREDEFGASLVIEVTWSGADLDRPSTGGFVLGAKHRKLAERLKRAVDAGAAFASPKVVTDCNGKSYVRADCLVMSRHMNYCLRRLGV
jgi:hypothetical protein